MPKVSSLTEITSLLATDELWIARSGTTKKIDASFLPGFELEYQEITANVSVTGTVEGTPTDIITCDAITLDGSTSILVDFFAMAIQTGASASSSVILNLWDASTNLGQIAYVQTTNASASIAAPIFARMKLTPGAGSHTYKARAWRQVANGVVLAGVGGSGAAVPAHMRVTKV